MIRAGIVGAGMAGFAHAAGYMASKQAAVAAVFDPNRTKAEELAAEHGAEVSASLDELLAKVDAVSICSPHRAHENDALAAVAAGKAVLMEKPLAVTIEGAERIRQSVRAQGTPFMMGMTHRYYPEIVEAKRLVEDGAIGDLHMAVDRMVFATDGFLPWVFKRSVSGGGVFLENGVHGVDRLRWFAGAEISEVTARVGTFAMDVDTEDNGMALLKFENGFVASLIQSVIPGDHLTCDLELYGSKGLIKVETWRGLELNNGQTHERRQVRSSMINLWDGITEGILSEVAAFVECLRCNQPPTITVDDGCADLQVIDAIYRSSESGAAVRLTSTNSPSAAEGS